MTPRLLSDCPSPQVKKSPPCQESSPNSAIASSPDNELNRPITKVTEAEMSNMLQVEKLGLIGRVQQQQALTASFDRMLHQANKDKPEATKKQLVFVKGNSGTGKSKLIHSLYQYVSTKDFDKPVILARGKYDFNEYFSEPYSGIVAAFEDIFKQVKTGKAYSSSIHEIGSALREQLGATAETLVRLVPVLEELLPMDDFSISVKSSDGHAENFNAEAAQKQLKYAFQVLTRVICEHCAALILVLDDLQWSDDASLDIIDYLISDVQNLNALMVVGSYRSNEVDETHILSQKLGVLRGKKTQNFAVTDIELGPFSVECTNDVVMRLLLIDNPAKTKGLADLCFKRTLGNPHFLIEFLMMLKDADLLRFGPMQWEWDVKRIENSTKLIDSVEDLILGRMRKLSEAQQLVLQLAACLGSSFQADILKIVWKNHSANTFGANSTIDVTSLLSGLQKGHFIESAGDSKYHWVHDKVQEAAVSLGDARQSSFQFEIGSILHKTLDEDQLDDMIFDVVDLINQGNVTRRPELARLNLQAAEKGRRVSAFVSAGVYAAHGIDLLPNDKWTTHRDMTLRLYTLGAQFGLATGDFSAMEEYSREILSQKSCTTMEKLPIQVARINRLCLTSKYGDAINISLNLMKELGCTLIPIRRLVSLQAIKSLISTIQMAKKIVPEEFCRSHPLLRDRQKRAIMELLGKVAYASFLSSNGFVFVLAITRMVQITMKHGIHSESGLAFATLGLIAKSEFGDFSTARLLADAARLMQTRERNNYQEAGAMFVAYTYSFSWTVPLQEMENPLKLNYLAGMKAGNNDYAFWSLLNQEVMMPLQTGRPLGQILSRCPELLYQMEDYEMEDHCFYTRLYWQYSLNLAGQAQEPMKLHGGIFNDNMDEDSIAMHIANAKKAQIELYVVYGAYEKAANLAFECGDSFEKISSLSFLCLAETFYRGLALYAGYQTTKQAKYKKHAKRALKKLSTWKKKGVPDVVHYHALLAAEQAGVDKKVKDADVLYQKAVELSASAGYLNCAALSNERYADFLDQKGPYFESRSDDVAFRLDEAMRYYKEWGAVRKAEDILKKKDGFNSKGKVADVASRQ